MTPRQHLDAWKGASPNRHWHVTHEASYNSENNTLDHYTVFVTSPDGQGMGADATLQLAVVAALNNYEANTTTYPQEDPS